jgi:mycofactocin precursor
MVPKTIIEGVTMSEETGLEDVALDQIDDDAADDAADDALLESLLVEEVSIDGMCGVY